MSTWPPVLSELKLDMKIDPTDIRDDGRLQQTLDAAVAFVERVRPVYQYDLLDAAQFGLPAPTDDVRLGTLRLAGRWHVRRRSQDGMIFVSQELGSARVPSFDADIERLLGIGRFAKPVIA
jgi:hypothetical protein